jgi:hypothetical protein
MLALENEPFRERKNRLPDSPCTVKELQGVFKAWWKTMGTRDCTALVAHVRVHWQGRGIPAPAELVRHDIYSFMAELVKVDSSLHPRHSRIVCAMLAEHGTKPCMTVKDRPEFEAMLIARTLLHSMTKYRDTAKMPERLSACLRKATVEEQHKLGVIFDAVAVQDPGYAVSLATAHPHVPADDDDDDDGGPSEFDALAAELGYMCIQLL